MHYKKILSIVISTYNRCELLKSNLEAMLLYEDENIEFIICDNCSTDHTWEMLNTIYDNRVKIFRNTQNFGAINAVLNITNVTSDYFTIVNDRDYILPQKITRLCNKLTELKDCDLLTTFGRKKMKEGYYEWNEILESFLMCDHPGNIVFNTRFYKKTIDLAYLTQEICIEKVNNYNIYRVFKIPFFLKKGYLFPPCFITQPENREKIKQTRKEKYGVAFVLPQYHILEYEELASYALAHIENPRTEKIMIELYRDGLKRVTNDYRKFVSIPFYCERNHCIGQTEKEWFKNGVQYTIFVLKNKKTRYLKIRKDIIRTYVYETICEIYRILREKIIG